MARKRRRGRPKAKRPVGRPSKAQQKLKKAVKRKRGAKFKAPPKFGSPEYAKLQAKWYARLKRPIKARKGRPAQEAFKDIEWVDKQTGMGHNTEYLLNTDSTKHYVHNTSTLDYYRLCTNFYTHNGHNLSPQHELIWKHWSEGATLRKIVSHFNKRFKPKRSLYWIFRQFEIIEAEMYSWNRTHAEGMLNEANVDFFISDIPIKDPDWFRKQFNGNF